VSNMSTAALRIVRDLSLCTAFLLASCSGSPTAPDGVPSPGSTGAPGVVSWVVLDAEPSAPWATPGSRLPPGVEVCRSPATACVADSSKSTRFVVTLATRPRRSVSLASWDRTAFGDAPFGGEHRSSAAEEQVVYTWAYEPIQGRGYEFVWRIRVEESGDDLRQPVVHQLDVDVARVPAPPGSLRHVCWADPRPTIRDGWILTDIEWGEAVVPNWHDRGRCPPPASAFLPWGRQYTMIFGLPHGRTLDVCTPLPTLPLRWTVVRPPFPGVRCQDHQVQRTTFVAGIMKD
jgi:hypothetical protein